MNNPLPLVIANLKANYTWEEMVTWLDQVSKRTIAFGGTVVICPSIPFLAAVAAKIKGANHNLKLGSQNVSQFEQGPYTGEFAATQISSLCQYVIIGHSERRQNFAEGDEIIAKKIQNAKASGVSPIYCVQDENAPIPQGVDLVAYEPISAVGTGNADTPENARSVAQKLKAKGNYTVIYGGSVTGENVKTFLKNGIIDGVLVGAASLDAESFIDIIESA